MQHILHVKPAEMHRSRSTCSSAGAAAETARQDLITREHKHDSEAVTL